MLLQRYVGTHMFRRILGMLVSVFFMGATLSVLIRVQLGTDPCSCMNLGFARVTGISFGTCQFSMNLLLALVVLFVNRRMIGLGTLGNMVLVGYVSDFFTWIWDQCLPPLETWGLLMRIGVMIPVLFLFVAAAASYMTANLGMAPYDCIPFLIVNRWKKLPFFVVRVTWDALAVLVGFLLGSTVGIVTVLIALSIGPVVPWFGRFFAKKIYKIDSIA